MSKFQSYQEITIRLSELADKLNNAQLSKEEMHEFQNLAQQLYERTVVLNYKAKEEMVFSFNSPSASVEIEQEAKPEVSQHEEEPEKEEDKNSGEIQFDFSSEEKETTDTSSNEPKVEQAIDKEPAKKPPKAQETPLKEDVSSNKKTERGHFSENEKDSSEAVEEELNDAFEDDKVQSFYEQFEKFHRASLGDRLGASKLDTLKGAIGLNDKLQFISELFKGDSDAFNASIDRLDNQESNINARKLLSQIASQQSWDEENPLVEEFARLIERRYVEE